MKRLVTLPACLLGLAILCGGEPASPIGRKIDDFKLRDYRGAERELREFGKARLVVVTFLGTDCPIARLYAPRLSGLAKEYEPRGVAFLGIDANQQDAIAEIERYTRDGHIAFPILRDVNNVVADRFGALRTPEAFVLDSERVIRYRGRIDDQYGIGFQRIKIGRRDLATALDELLSGKPVSVPETAAPGCFIGRIKPEPKSDALTYSKHVAPIFQSHCVECHHTGEIGPFSLTSYDEAIGWIDTIREVVHQGRMPPWHAAPKYGKFANDIRLTDSEKKLIIDWIDNGAPAGDPKDLPKPVTFAEGWRIPKPDVVLTIPKPYKVPARGDIEYEFVVVDPGFKEDKWVKAAEIRPSCRAVVHHVLVFVQPPNSAGWGKHDGFIDNWLAGHVPGARPMLLPDGMAKLVPAGSRLLFQIHYTPNGAPHEDQTAIGLVFADPKTVQKQIRTEMVFNPRFQIPPRAESYPVEAEDVLTEDTYILTLVPHTHLRGKAFQFEAIYPDGKREVLLDVPNYDFNWQNTYILAEPKLLPKGTTIHCMAFYDNSKKNPSNPNPEAEVRWGDQTWEEMMIGYYDAYSVTQDLLKKPLPARASPKPLAKLDPGLESKAKHALDSQKSFEEFAKAVKEQLPKVDRVCLTEYSKGMLKVERCAYPGKVLFRIGETGFERPGKAFALVFYALANQYGVIPDLKQGQGIDMALLGKTLGSSAHVPVAVAGKPGSLNFWSKETKAFPADVEPVLRALASAVTESR
jgi:peroxiredoxin/mono/diheme cytochrome c family protein